MTEFTFDTLGGYSSELLKILVEDYDLTPREKDMVDFFRAVHAMMDDVRVFKSRNHRCPLTRKVLVEKIPSLAKIEFDLQKERGDLSRPYNQLAVRIPYAKRKKAKFVYGTATLTAALFTADMGINALEKPGVANVAVLIVSAGLTLAGAATGYYKTKRTPLTSEEKKRAQELLSGIERNNEKRNYLNSALRPILHPCLCPA